MQSKILVVDDEHSIRAAMKDYFSVYGYDVDCAQELRSVQELVAQGRYGAAFVDLCLTGSEDMDGLAVVGFLRDRCPETWIIVLTALGSPSLEESARRLGADLFLHKPQSLAMMKNLVVRLFGSRS
jgi:DNA-binding response OmpR family regulator